MYRVNLEKFRMRKLCDTKLKKKNVTAQDYKNYETVPINDETLKFSFAFS